MGSLMSGKVLYTNSHEWIKQSGDGEWVVGISEYAAEQLGDVVYVELPEIGKDCSAKGEVAVIESVKTASDIYAPITGKIASVNTALEDNPQLVNESPLEQGWLFKITAEAEPDLGELLDEKAYQSFAGSE